MVYCADAEQGYIFHILMKGLKMNTPGFRLVTVISASMFVLFSCSGMKQSGQNVGYDTRDLTRSIGYTTRDITREIGHSTRDLVISVGGDVNQAAGPRSK